MASNSLRYLDTKLEIRPVQGVNVFFLKAIAYLKQLVVVIE
jgi:hypothetical protein